MSVACPVCDAVASTLYREVDGYDYLQCASCGSIHIDERVLAVIDAGEQTRVYDEGYWAAELRAAEERSYGSSLVRAGECILYARRPVRAFLDVGTGPGYLLDALSDLLPTRRAMFHGVELFPPAKHSEHANYLVGDISDLSGTFDAGVCIEMVEHLTPTMLRNLIRSLAKISAPNALWLFNTGMPDYVLNQDPGYLDPLRRGHIVSYGASALEAMFSAHGFVFRVIPGKNYAFLAEYQGDAGAWDFEARINAPLPENKALLEENALLYMASFESARSSYYFDQYLARSRWALGLDEDLRRTREANVELEQRLLSSIALVENERQKLETELAEVTQAYRRVINSRSYALTAPLRKLSAWYRSIQRRR